MKKKSLTLLVAATLASSVLFSSCIGSFGLSNKLLDWNRNIDSKFVNELVFVAFWIVPVYEISALADILVLNSIEFWSGSNPVADAGTVKTIETKDGTYAIETQKDGYHIQKEGEETSLPEPESSRSLYGAGDPCGRRAWRRGRHPGLPAGQGQRLRQRRKYYHGAALQR